MAGGYGAARVVGSPRGARWTATLIPVAGSAVGWATVNAFRV